MNLLLIKKMINPNCSDALLPMT